MTTRITDIHRAPDTHANRPAATAVGFGTLYPCSTHNLIYRSDGTTWSTWAVLLPPGGTSGQVPTKNSSTDGDVSWGTPASGGSTETYENVVTAMTGKVHRWAFDETSGATVADSIGSLNLTLSGTYTRNVTAPVGVGTTFGATAKATSSGLGSLPTGGNARCCIVVYYQATGTATKQSLLSYGPTGTTRGWWNCVLQPSASFANEIGVAVWSDDLAQNNVFNAGTWRLAAFGYDNVSPVGATTYAYCDNVLATKQLGGVLNTGTTGNMQIGLSTNSDGQFAGSIADVIVLNNWPGKQMLDRLRRALPA